MYLNQTHAAGADSTQFNSTAPTASVFTLGTGGDINASGVDIIAWCFHSVEGYSKVGGYEGNGNANGAFIYTGFKPAYVMCKNIDATFNWMLFDSKRGAYNIIDEILEANTSDEERASGAYPKVDFLSNGVKWRDSSGENNGSYTYIYIAFASSP